MQIRRFQPGDEPALFRVFFSAIHQVASRDYTQQQVDAWAPPDMDTTQWTARMRGIQPFVALLGDEIVGYADLQQSGYIDQFFVSGAHPRQGIGRLLMARIHEEAVNLGIAVLTSDVSVTAEPFFAHHGFEVVQRQQPVRRGVVLANARMRKALAPSIGPSFSAPAPS